MKPDTFMQWYDNSQNTLKQKIEYAIKYYVNKYEQAPELCLLHSFSQEFAIEGLEIRGYRYVLLGQIWLGMKEAGD